MASWHLPFTYEFEAGSFQIAGLPHTPSRVTLSHGPVTEGDRSFSPSHRGRVTSEHLGLGTQPLLLQQRGAMSSRSS